ncbi:hypothetical protein T02_4505 [Trichinella nativa]|uniref:Uncharacterized protein n=1 Tax=Trichinella nativa TaxID=6335 RepID=A0A0V1KGW4_9BILA|nr:hypothetical protein T02_4505 [Trichinella nativa]
MCTTCVQAAGGRRRASNPMQLEELNPGPLQEQAVL